MAACRLAHILFHKTSDHFTEGIQITQSHVAFHISLETVPVCFAEGDGPNLHCCQSSTPLLFISLLQWEWSWRKTNIWQESQMLAAHSPCAACCVTSSTEAHQQLFALSQQYLLLLQKTLPGWEQLQQGTSSWGLPSSLRGKHHQAVQEAHSNSNTSLMWAVLS